jgi:hypothetical protein
MNRHGSRAKAQDGHDPRFLSLLFGVAVAAAAIATALGPLLMKIAGN